MPRRGRQRKKTRTHEAQNEGAQSALASKQDEKVPKSLVVRRGKTSPEVSELVDDLRHVMLPFTALHFNEDPKNRKLTLSQYAKALALPMGITHILALSQNEDRLNLRLARLPEGPTLSFRVHRFSLNRHIKTLQKRPVATTPALQAHPPIVVTNNFADNSAHIKLLRITFQNLFPAINVATVQLKDVRRVVLFQFQDGFVEMRHYAIKASPVGVHRRVRRLVQAKVPNLAKCQDISEYLQAQLSEAPSDSEAEDGAQHVVQLPESYIGRGNQKSQTSALKLIEMGPRLRLELLKVEKGLGVGDVLYHAHISKTPEEAAALKKRKQEEAALKEQRRAKQIANVERKQKTAEEKRAAKRQRQLEREEAQMSELRGDNKEDSHDDESNHE